MKKLLLVFFGLLSVSVYAQDTVKKSNSIGKFNEQFMVLKSDKKVRHGSYQLIIDKKTVASGKYENGKRAGVWSFYNDGEIEQQYDFSAGKLVMNKANAAIKTDVGDASPTDSVSPAVKVGGFNGVKLLVASTDFESSVLDAGNNKITHAFTLDESGNIRSWVAMIKSSDGIKVVNPTLGDVPAEIVMFIPAALNGKAVGSTVTFDAEMNGAGPGQTGPAPNGKPNQRGGRKGRG